MPLLRFISQKAFVFPLLLASLVALSFDARSAEPVLHYIGHGAQQTVSGSLHELRTAHGSYLIDVGLFMSGEGENYPWPSSLPIRNIRAVVITHAHADHIGRLPLLLNLGYRGPIYMTRVTYDLARLTLRDSIALADFGEERFYYSRNNVGNDRIPVFMDGHDFGRYTIRPSNRIYIRSRRSELSDRGFYIAGPQRRILEEELLDKLESQVRIIEFHKPVQVDDLQIELIPTSHMPGSAMVSITGKGCGLFFSGDIGSDSSPLMEQNPSLDREIDYLWIEGTYAQIRALDYAEERAAFRRDIGDLISKGHRVVIPSFVVDRTQQVLYEIALGMADGEIPPQTPVKVYSRTANEITELYDSYARDYDSVRSYFSEAMRGAKIAPGSVLAPTVKWDAGDPLELRHGEIGIMSSGMAEHAYSRRAIEDYGNDSRTVFYFVGYQAPGTPGHQLRTGERNVLLDGRRVRVNAVIRSTSAFSGHADPAQIHAIFEGSVVRNIFLTHLDASNIENLTTFYKDKLGAPVLAPRAGDALPLSCSQ